jgi:hypothetical protein
MVQHRHGVDADADTELADGKTGLAEMREHIERRIQNDIAVKAPASAGAGFRAVCCP